MELAEAISKIASELREAISEAREKGYSEERFFEHLVRARMELLAAIEYMFACGKIDPETYSKIVEEQERHLREELGEKG